MAEIGNNLKNIWMRGMEAIGNTASSIASNTRFKVDEMNLVNRKSEILKDFGAKAYALWQKGERFPDELEAQLLELGQLDEKLNDLRAEHFAGIQTKASEESKADAEQPAEDAGVPAEADAGDDGAADASGADPEPEAEAPASEEADAPEADLPEDVPADVAEDAAADVPVIRVEPAAEEKPEVSPLSSAISELFDKIPAAEEAGAKVDQAIDSLGDALHKTSDRLDAVLEELDQKINPDQDA